MTSHNVSEILFDREALARRVADLAEEIAQRRPADLLAVGILRGCFVFLADLVRALSERGVRLNVDFLVLSSYGNDVESSGNVRVLQDLRETAKDRDVLLVDDILDTGRTLAFARRLLLERGARSVATCALLDKPSRRVVDFEADHVGFSIPDAFVVGYGLDYANRYRELPHLAVLPEAPEEDRSSGTPSPA